MSNPPPFEIPRTSDPQLNRFLTQLKPFLYTLWPLVESGLRVVDVPSTATNTGVAGDISYDTSYFYICVADNTWRRVSLSSW